MEYFFFGVAQGGIATAEHSAKEFCIRRRRRMLLLLLFCWDKAKKKH